MAIGYLRRGLFSRVGILYCYFTILLLRRAYGYPQSPCPDILQYEYSSNRHLIASIDVPVLDDYGNKIAIDLEISAEFSPQGSRGELAMLNPLTEVIEDVYEERHLRYKLEFFHSTESPPVITSIAMNRNEVCRGNPLLNDTTAGQYTFNHELRIPGPHIADVRQKRRPFRKSVTRKSPESFTKPTTQPYRPRTTTIINNFIHSSDSKYYHYSVHHHDHYHFPPFYQTDSATDQSGSGFKNIGRRPSPEPSDDKFYSNQVTQAVTTPSTIPLYQRPYFQSTQINNRIQGTTTPRSYFNTRTTKRQFSTVGPFRRTTANPAEYRKLLQRLIPFAKGDCGKAATRGVHPWLSAVFLQYVDGLRFICGSTLISSKYVITVAHCVTQRFGRFKAEELLIAIGKQNLKTWSNDGSQFIQAETINIHPDYKRNAADADVAIIALKEEAAFTDLVKPACMWMGPTDINLIAKRSGIVAGWGTDEFNNVITAEAGEVKLPVVSAEDCLWTNNAFYNITSDRTFCAGNRDNSGPCTGDSGSGFLMKMSDGSTERWTLRGIVSLALAKPDKTCDLAEYVVFVDVTKFLGWILEFLENP